MNEETTEQPQGPSYLFDLTEVESEHSLLLQKEAADRARVDTIEFPDTEALGAKLVEWANNGFADGFAIFSITVDPPAVCSDGVHRKLFEYIAYLAGVSVGDKMARLSAKLKGMYVQCSYSGNTVTSTSLRTELLVRMSTREILNEVPLPGEVSFHRLTFWNRENARKV